MPARHDKRRDEQRDGTPEKESWRKRVGEVIVQVCGLQQPLLRLSRPSGCSCKAVVRRKPSVHRERHERTARRNRHRSYDTPKLEGDPSHSWAVIPVIDRRLSDPYGVPNAGPDPNDDASSGSLEEYNGNNGDASSHESIRSPRNHLHGVPSLRRVSDNDLSGTLTDPGESEYEDSVTSLSSAPTDVIKDQENDDNDLGDKTDAEIDISSNAGPVKQTQDFPVAGVALRSQDTTEKADSEDHASGNEDCETQPKTGDNQACSSSQLSIKVGGVYFLKIRDRDDRLNCENHPIIITEIIPDGININPRFIIGCIGTSHPKLVKFKKWKTNYLILDGLEKNEFETGGVKKPTKADLFLQGEQMPYETYVNVTESRPFEVSQIKLLGGKELTLTKKSLKTLLKRKRTQQHGR
ncbi:hypothetical protein FSARC_494 [Fusarium sarcochroum]|uniref:Uncharacterized protein n=1 Tax=Fusarium sarcochroum TaxID=1208366 RepID=A0A8H4UBI6_9HYPO|nr:hypothetical protein FSARC_494 [Fusarium sarcochroum]